MGSSRGRDAGRSMVLRVHWVRRVAWNMSEFNEIKGKTNSDPAFQTKHLRKSLGSTFAPQ